MSTPIQVFICYKKLLAGNRPNEKAGILHHILSQDKASCLPWFDESGLSAGMIWETEIYRRLLVSDVLLVLVGPGTAESPWVKREIALAVALGIAVVPLGFDMSSQELAGELKALEIGHMQGRLTQNIKLNTIDALQSELRQDLQGARQITQTQQKTTLKDLLARVQPPPSPAMAAGQAKAADKQRAASFTLKVAGREIALHVASGDMSRLRDIHVLVNSENNHMQMARFFETRTVSSMLRSRGARLRNNRYADTIQQELDGLLGERERPVRMGEVFATSAGCHDSALSLAKARHIFHVAAVEAVASKGIVIPFQQAYQIEDCVRKVLGKLAEVNQLQGVVSPPGSEPHAEQVARAAQGKGVSRSILFPLFGTGQGGNSASEVIGPMLAGISGHLDDPDNAELAATLDEIYISAFRQQDVDDVVQVLRAALP